MAKFNDDGLVKSRHSGEGWGPWSM